MADSPLFSESWHLVADQKLCLRKEILVRRQAYRGRLWYVLGDPYAHRFYRITPEAHEFLERLDGRRTIEDVWLEAMGDDPDTSPGQQELIGTLAQLFQAGLLRAEKPLESERLFRHVHQQSRQAMRAQLLQFLFLRIPLWDPDRFLNATRALWRLLVSPAGAVAWVLMLLVGGLHLVGNTERLVSQSEGILSASNIGWLYLTWVLVKFFHEMGHAAVCKRFGGQVHVMGIMLLVFMPFPYVDATAAWFFRERWKRVLTGAAGILVELFLAAVAAVVWANTSPGVVHLVAYNVMFLASVSTLLFNLNPLLRFDGYYILSDLVDTPNLHARSQKQLLYGIERGLFGLRSARNPATSAREGFWLTVFALASGIYRVFVLALILFFLSDRFLGLGLVLACASLVMWAVVPLWKAGAYLAGNARIAPVRGRAVAVTCGLLGLIGVLLFVVPFPRHFRAPGVIRAEPAFEIINEVAGQIEEVKVLSGGRVEKGDLLVVLANPELQTEWQRMVAEIEEVEARRSLAMQRAPAYVRPLDERLQALRERQQSLRRQIDALEVRAQGAGEWSAPALRQAAGIRVPRGALLGTVVSGEDYRFVAVISQEDAASLFGENIRSSEVRLRGQANYALSGSGLKIAPADRRRLPTPSLGWMAGGSVQVRTGDDSGTEALEPWFEVSLSLSADSGVELAHQRLGVARFELEPEPLGWQWVRRFRQLLQRRLGI